MLDERPFPLSPEDEARASDRRVSNLQRTCPQTSGVRIAELAADTGTTVRALRHYEDAGLIRPDRTPGNARIYGPETRQRVKLIVELRRLGLSLDDISTTLTVGDDSESASRALAVRLKARLEIVEEQHRALSDAIARLSPD